MLPRLNSATSSAAFIMPSAPLLNCSMPFSIATRACAAPSVTIFCACAAPSAAIFFTSALLSAMSSTLSAVALSLTVAASGAVSRAFRFAGPAVRADLLRCNMVGGVANCPFALQAFFCGAQK